MRLIMQLKKFSKADAVQLLATCHGLEIEYHEPDGLVEATYSYFDKNGKLLKEVLRYPGKRFRQRRLQDGGWAWDVQGVKPSLYNLERLQFEQTVIIVEGEKGCDRLNKLLLTDSSGGRIIAATSGGAESWSDDLADDLLYHRVILMPDDDKPGKQYEDAIRASLEKRGIEFRIVKFTDVGAKDVTEFLEQGHSREDLERRIGTLWIVAPEPEEEYAEA